jgi:phytoene dehydrogenase-like protein
MKDKSLIIIGAGIAGLSTGCYAQMNGYKSVIFELHDKPGGLCTSWKRNGYIIDSCIHWLVGSSPVNPFYRLWEEVGAVQGRQMIDHEVFGQVEGKDGNVLIMYTNIKRLEEHLRNIAPEDNKVIDDLINGLYSALRFPTLVEKAPEVFNIIDTGKMFFKMAPHIGFLRKWGAISIQDFAKRFKNPFLREVFPLFFDLPDFPMLAVLMTFAWMHQKAAGYPIGGSLEFSKAIEKRYLDLGGEIHYKSPVSKVLVECNKATGLILSDGTQHRADTVISAADGHSTIFDLLEGKYVDDKIKTYYQNLPIFPPIVFVSIGTSHQFNDVAPIIPIIKFPLSSPITIGRQQLNWLAVQIHNFDPTLAPEGKTLLTTFFDTDYSYWKELKKDPDLYNAEKEEVARNIIKALDQRFPGLSGKLEMCDIATPVTFERYTGNWQGSYEGWLITTKTMNIQMKKTLPGLDNFYMVGQWVSPGGGVPSGILTGRQVMQIICKRDGKKFVTSRPQGSN